MKNKRVLGIIASAGVGSLSALAGSASWDFSSDPLTGPTPLVLMGNGSGGGDWIPSGGVTGGNADGYLSITGPTTGQWAKIIFPDIDGGKVIAAFTFECMLRIGNGSTTPADGFSINYARATDPTFTKDGNGDYQQGGWSGTANEPGSDGTSMAGLPEEGTITGLAIGFDAYNSGSALWPADLNGSLNDVIGISVRVDNKVVAQVPLSSQNTTCDDNTSLQTGPINENGPDDYSTLCWQPFKVQLTEDGHLSVWWKGRAVVDNLLVEFAPGPGRLVFGGRTGDLYQNQHIDSIVLNTIAAEKAVVGTPTADALGVTVTIEDSGDSSVDPTTVKVALDGAAPTAVTATKSGKTTTARWNAPSYLVSGAEVTVDVTCTDTRGIAITGSRKATVAAYTMIPPAFKVPTASVDTAKKGFLVRPFQTAAAQPNNLQWTEEQLLGLHGENIADLTGATGGLYTRDTVINFNAAAPADAGNFNSTNERTDEQFLGVPGTTASTGNTSQEIMAYLDFPTAGLYQLGVNSDDGFRVSAGRAPGDLLGVILGAFDGGRGAVDSIFTVLIDQPGLYPIRLIWENGNGELPDNGSSLEFFSMKDGVKTLINDTTTGAIKAYRQSTADGPYLTYVSPVRNATAVPGNAVIKAEINQGSAQVDSATVKAKLNGVDVAANVTTSGAKTTVTLTPAGLLPSASTQIVTIAFSDKSTPAVAYTAEWQFAVAPYTVLSEDVVTDSGTGDATKPGMKVRVWQVDQPGGNSLANRTHRAEQELAGIIGPNVANLDAATAGVFNVDTINWNQDSTGIGSFTADETPIPGIPGNGSKPDDSVAAEIQTYLEFPTAGFYAMGVYSDDGYKFTTTEAPPVNNLALVVTGAASAAGSYATVSGPAATSKPFTAPITGELVYMDPAQGCTAPVNAAALAGKIALVDRGTCNFSLKIKYAREAGALAVVVVNNRPIDHADGIYPFEMGVGDVGYQDLPAVMISMPDGDKIKTGIASGLTVSLAPDTTPAVSENDGGSLGETIFYFIVPKAGVYPFRAVWFEGNGGANFEWWSITPDGKRILVNDRATTGAIKAYRARTASPQVKPTISLGTQGGNVVITFTGTLQAADAVTGTWTDVNATSPYSTATSGAMKFYRAKK